MIAQAREGPSVTGYSMIVPSYRRGQGACYAFSPLLVSPHGNSIVSADIQRLYKTYYFTPFSEAELTQYLNAKFPKNTQPELLIEHLKLM